jgi:hypothetical protein
MDYRSAALPVLCVAFADRPRRDRAWVHEIKHDGFCVMVWRDRVRSTFYQSMARKRPARSAR